MHGQEVPIRAASSCWVREAGQDSGQRKKLGPYLVGPSPSQMVMLDSRY